MASNINGSIDSTSEPVRRQLTIAHMTGMEALYMGLELGSTRHSFNAPFGPGHGSATLLEPFVVRDAS